MCGIAGIVESNPSGTIRTDQLQAMLDALRHRGPDGSSSWQSPCHTAAFAHARLAILDLSPAGIQPMSSQMVALPSHSTVRSSTSGRSGKN